MSERIIHSEQRWDSIEEWAIAHGLTLEDALEGGVSQDDDGNIDLPRETWKALPPRETRDAELVCPRCGEPAGVCECPAEEVTRYRVDQAGRSGMRAFVTDTRTHEIVLTTGGPDRFVVADGIAAILNNSRTEVPVVRRPYVDPITRESIANLVNYSWASEEADIVQSEREGNDTEGHIFRDLERLQAWLEANR